MEYAEVELVCKKCKTTFVYKKLCHNRHEAEIAEQRAVRRRKPLCPACLRDEQEAAEIVKAAEMGLPELVGRSEKQVSFAFSLRSRYIRKNGAAIRKAQTFLNGIDPARVTEIAEKNGFIDAEDCIAAAFRQRELYLEYLCLTECNAQILIDRLSTQGTPKK